MAEEKNAEATPAPEKKVITAPREASPNRKAAIAILALGADLAREIFRALPPRDIERLMVVAENLHDVTSEEVLEALKDLTNEVDRRGAGVSGHEHTLQQAAAQALGTDALSAIISKDTGAGTQLEMVASRDTRASPWFRRESSRGPPQLSCPSGP